jgi:hypothetical protein
MTNEEVNARWAVISFGIRVLGIDSDFGFRHSGLELALVIGISPNPALPLPLSIVASCS